MGLLASGSRRTCPSTTRTAAGAANARKRFSRCRCRHDTRVSRVGKGPGKGELMRFDRVTPDRPECGASGSLCDHTLSTLCDLQGYRGVPHHLPVSLAFPDLLAVFLDALVMVGEIVSGHCITEKQHHRKTAFTMPWRGHIGGASSYAGPQSPGAGRVGRRA